MSTPLSTRSSSNRSPFSSTYASQIADARLQWSKAEPAIKNTLALAQQCIQTFNPQEISPLMDHAIEGKYGRRYTLYTKCIENKKTLETISTIYRTTIAECRIDLEPNTMEVINRLGFDCQGMVNLLSLQIQQMTQEQTSMQSLDEKSNQTIQGLETMLSNPVFEKFHFDDSWWHKDTPNAMNDSFSWPSRPSSTADLTARSPTPFGASAATPTAGKRGSSVGFLPQ